MQETLEANFRLAQFERALIGDFEIKTRIDMKWILDKIKDVNFKVSATKYLQKNHKELIGATALHIAADNRHLDSFRFLLDLGVDYTTKNDDNMTALHIIIEEDDSILEKNILDDSFIHMVLSAHLKNSNFGNPSNNSGISHFHIACAANNVEVVQGFLCSGVAISDSVKVDSSLFPGFTPLHFASKYCASEVVEVLLSHGADIHAKNAKGMTPLLLVLESKLKIVPEATLDEEVSDRNEKILRLFLEKESSDDMMIRENWGLSHLHVTCTLKDFKIAEGLLQKVVNINSSVKIDSPLWPGFTAMHFAALCNIDTVKLLMKTGADISIKDAKGVTPFDICIERYKVEDIHAILSLHSIWKNITLSDGKTKLTDFLFAMRNLNDFSIFLKRLSKNAMVSNSPLWQGYTPMHLAVLFSDKISDSSKTNSGKINFPILRKLHDKSRSMIHSQDAHGRTPLHLAFLMNKQPAIDLLLQFLEEARSTVPDLVDEDGLSYVHIASAKDNTSLLKRMLSVGSDVNAVYKGTSMISRTIHPGSTALHFAVVYGSIAAVEILMNRDADVHVKDANDMTPIHLLLMNSEADILLSSRNLKDSIVNGFGLSHLHVATRCNKPEAVKKLLDDGANVNSVITYKPDANTEPNELSFLKQYDAYSPLVIAYSESYYSITCLLLKYGADIFVEDTEKKPLLYELIEEGTSKSDLEEFMKTIKGNEDLQIRLKVETGMTALHVACLFNDYETIRRLLNDGAKVNEQIRFDSPIFQGYTPLHITLFASKVYDVGKSIELLIEKGSDVTVLNLKSDTAVHMAYSMNEDEVAHPENVYYYLYWMLEAQRDLSVNPVNACGLTHFHIACNISMARIVKKFLKYADIDINQPIDYFHEKEPGYTALRLDLGDMSETDTVFTQLETVDILLEHGANVHVEDSYGDTPLHNCVRFGLNFCSLDLFERITRFGANVNAKNLDGNTPMFYYLQSDKMTSEGIKMLLRTGCRLNIFSSVNEYGCMGQILRRLEFDKLQKLFFILTVNFKQEIAIDDAGRTAIHNIVSDDQVKISTNEYTTLIATLSRAGFDVDCQDKLGRTALHMAVNFHNREGVSSLLIAGADANITDSNGKTALGYDVDTCTLCQSADENSTKPIDKVREHLETLEVLAIHINKLQSCGLEVNKQNEDYTVKTFEKLERNPVLTDVFFNELESIKNTIIKCRQPLLLNDFLSETDAVARYPRMSWLQREAVKKLFSLRNFENLREKFPELAGVFQLQYRKARARVQLLISARSALMVLTGFRLPEICSDCIFVLLKNSELNNLIASTVQ